MLWVTTPQASQPASSRAISGKSGFSGVEDQGAIALSQAFDRQLAMQDGDDDIPGLGRDGAVDNEKVAVEYSGIAHGFALRADEKGRRRAADQMQIEIKLALDMVGGGAWKSGGYPGAVERQGEVGGLIGENAARRRALGVDTDIT